MAGGMNIQVSCEPGFYSTRSSLSGIAGEHFYRLSRLVLLDCNFYHFFGVVTICMMCGAMTRNFFYHGSCSRRFGDAGSLVVVVVG